MLNVAIFDTRLCFALLSATLKRKHFKKLIFLDTALSAIKIVFTYATKLIRDTARDLSLSKK